MATQVKLTIKRGVRDLKGTVITAGTAITGSDAMELNIDITKVTKGEAIVMLDQLRDKIFQGKWPPAVT